MARGNTGLDSNAYDGWLADNKKEGELRKRNIERKKANKGYEGWHFGLGEKPIRTENKADFKRELDKRGLVMRDDVKRDLR